MSFKEEKYDDFWKSKKIFMNMILPLEMVKFTNEV